MQISLSNIGRKFRKEWIFRSLTENFAENTAIAIEGPNGSGKSTLLKIISGSELPTEGLLKYVEANKSVEAEEIYKKVSYAAPYMDLPEQFSLEELLHFHQNLKGIYPKMSVIELMEQMQLSDSKNKLVKDFSSGMKQRLKLGLAIFTNSTLLLLDEPCANLDQKSIEWYKESLLHHSKNRMILIASNRNEDETFISKHKINLLDYK